MSNSYLQNDAYNAGGGSSAAGACSLLGTYDFSGAADSPLIVALDSKLIKVGFEFNWVTQNIGNSSLVQASLYIANDTTAANYQVDSIGVNNAAPSGATNQNRLPWIAYTKRDAVYNGFAEGFVTCDRRASAPPRQKLVWTSKERAITAGAFYQNSANWNQSAAPNTIYFERLQGIQGRLTLWGYSE